MTKADTYRQKAEEADKAARDSRDPWARRAFEDLAREWRKLALQVEQRWAS